MYSFSVLTLLESKESCLRQTAWGTYRRGKNPHEAEAEGAEAKTASCPIDPGGAFPLQSIWEHTEFKEWKPILNTDRTFMKRNDKTISKIFLCNHFNVSVQEVAESYFSTSIAVRLGHFQLKF